MGPLIPMFWTSGDVSSGFQSLGGGIHDICSLRFTSGETLADLLVAGMAADRFPTYMFQ